MYTEDVLSQANQLMQEGEKQQAASLLEGVLQNSPSDTDYVDVVAIYLGGYMYDEALAVFRKYTENTGKDLDKISDYKLQDIQKEKLEYMRSQSTAVVEPYSGETVTLWPMSPTYVFFTVAFIAFGIWLFYLGLHKANSGTLYWRFTNEVYGGAFSLFGICTIVVAILGMFTYMRADAEGLTILGARYKIKHGLPQMVRIFWLPHRRTIPYASIVKATIEMVAVGSRSGSSSIGPVLKLILKDGSYDLVNLGPFPMKDCRKLALQLRSRGVSVFALPGVLGKDYSN